MLKKEPLKRLRGLPNRLKPTNGQSLVFQRHISTIDLIYKSSPFVFPGRGGRQRISCQAQINEVKIRRAPYRISTNAWPTTRLCIHDGEFRKSRHVFLQRLLTHKDPRMTQRYAHLRDETLKKASDVAADIIEQVSTTEDEVSDLTTNK
jgi:integrase